MYVSRSASDAGVVLTLTSHTLTSNAFNAKISDDGETLYFGDESFSTVFAVTRVGSGVFDGSHIVASAIQAPIALSDDELTMYNSDTTGIASVQAATRVDRTATFGPGSLIPNVSSSGWDTPVALTADGCVLSIASNRAGRLGGYDIWEAHRPR